MKTILVSLFIALSASAGILDTPAPSLTTITNVALTTATNWPFAANVRAFGAKGDGIADDTAAFQAAQTNQIVYVPAGRYVISELYLTNAQRIYGDGKSSVLVHSGNASVINTVNHATRIENLAFQGLEDGTNWQIEGSIGSRSGIALWTVGEASVTGCEFRGFSHSAIRMTGEPNPNTRYNFALIAGNWISNCYHGVFSQTNEYTRIENNSIRYCRNGIVSYSPNYVIVGNAIVDVATGIYIVGYGTRAHGTITGNQINHCSWIVDINGVGTGISIVGNQMMGNSGWIMWTSTNVLVAANTIQTSKLEFYECGTNWFRNNIFHGMPVTLTHSNDAVRFVDNYNINGALVDGNTNYNITADSLFSRRSITGGTIQASNRLEMVRSIVPTNFGVWIGTNTVGVGTPSLCETNGKFGINRLPSAAYDLALSGGITAGSGALIGGTVTATTFSGSGVGLSFTNAAGSAFKLIVNSTTNGFTFVPQ